jgi:hypothetical protein
MHDEFAHQAEQPEDKLDGKVHTDTDDENNESVDYDFLD